MPPWERVVATPDLWPDELIDDITGWFDDLRGRWPDVVWWVRRVHEASVSSRMPLFQQVNYVLITSDDFHAFARNPHGLMELGFRDPQLHTTVLPHLINMPTLRTFLVPLWAGMQTSLTVRASLNGIIALAHQLVACESGFYLYPGKAVHIWCHRLSTWPGRTHSSCTDPRRLSRVVTSTIVELRSTYLEAIG